jgi:hypothetical protein
MKMLIIGAAWLTADCAAVCLRRGAWDRYSRTSETAAMDKPTSAPASTSLG